MAEEKWDIIDIIGRQKRRNDRKIEEKKRERERERERVWKR
jgi:hypothetical protein